MAAFKLEVTIFFNVFLILSVILCCLVFSSISYLAVAKKKTLFLISTGHILMDIMLLLGYLLYLMPVAYADDYIFPGGMLSVYGQIAIYGALWSWLAITIFNIFMAVNRFIVFCCPYLDIFSYRNTGCITIGILLLGFILSAVAQYILPCCLMIFNHHFIAHTFVKSNSTNYVNLFILSPLNISSSVIAGICYISIFISIQKTSRMVSQSGKKQRNDILFAVQFFAISLFHFIEWSSFRILPYFIDMSSTVFNPLFLIVGFSITINASMNSFIYVTFNKEVRNQLIHMVCRTKRHASNVTVTPVLTVTHAPPSSKS